MAAVNITIEELSDPANDAGVGDMLVELTLGEQGHYSHPPESDAELRRRLRVTPRFSGENHILVARDARGELVGLCWVVLFDPGTGLEAEVAELFVRPERRGEGIAGLLIDSAMALIRRRHVTFAAVWTRHDNQAALAAYRRAGFSVTEQAVLTWLPLDDGQPG